MSIKPEEKAREVDRLLEVSYGMPSIKGSGDVLGDLILTLLSHNTNDSNRDKAFAELRKRYKTWEALLDTPREDIEDAIRTAGLARAKSEYIKETLDFVKDNYGDLDLNWICSRDPEWVEKTFTQVKGIGVKTINVVLAFGCGADRFPIDTHVNRICTRLGFVPEGTPPEKTYRIMKEIFPRGKGNSMHLNIIRHGRAVCKSRNPDCEKCNLTDLCAYFKEK